VRNYIPSHQWVIDGGWNIADCVSRSYKPEGMEAGTVAAGRIGLAVLRRLKPFEVKLHYTDRHRPPDSVEEELNLTSHPDAAAMVRVCDVVTINAPLHPETEHLFDDALIGQMKRGAYLVNTARGRICDRDAVVRAFRHRWCSPCRSAPGQVVCGGAGIGAPRIAVPEASAPAVCMSLAGARWPLTSVRTKK
jgi:formate dehydrogenase